MGDTSGFSRRRLLAGTAAAGGLAVLAPGAAGAHAVGGKGWPSVGSVVIGPGDPRYADLARRGVNHRFAARPEYFQVVGSTEQVVRAVGDAVRAGKRITVRSGGHCQENFVGDPAVDVVLDLGELRAVYYDPSRRAFVIEPGATLQEVYRRLYFGWDVTLPGGECGTVGAGGHIQGGGYGPMSRMFGSTVDHLYAVEVVVVGRDGRARAVVATREPDDPHRDLWWAHTGGGGGNFGVVTKYWMRSPDATGDDPGGLLPKPPATLTTGSRTWAWSDLTAASFRRIVRNHGEWHERNSAPDSVYAGLFSALFLPPKSLGGITVSARVAGGERLLRDYFDALAEGVPAPATPGPVTTMPWFAATNQSIQAQVSDDSRYKQKAAYLRRCFTDRQIDAIHHHLTSYDQNVFGAVELLSYGGKVNTVAPDATALPQRDSILKVLYLGFSTEPAQDPAAVGWAREIYRSVYAETGGMPVPNQVDDGCYINYPDIDALDPEWNRSGVPWHTLYYKENYPRLQRVKAAYDPRDVFHHPLSVKRR
ncbi:FAD-binding oxidoreductase [Actinokineospora iranica]|uniref:FAD/FMN-containing dehydrogenase n=1 Tax=Actinokineospora iranica TaxID=1271860 RepID=A0A1G6JYS1_9PSEU|nr:FAD-binding protein [Actinokineospora iranica]SDC23741.1 FAD/FMN-containing dehydrogenase [Actinokineospora iranica]